VEGDLVNWKGLQQSGHNLL